MNHCVKTSIIFIFIWTTWAVIERLNIQYLDMDFLWIGISKLLNISKNETTSGRHVEQKQGQSHKKAQMQGQGQDKPHMQGQSQKKAQRQGAES